MIETKFKIRKHIKKFELQFERATVRNQQKFMNVGWNTPPNQSNMENLYFCVRTCWIKFCSETNFIEHHPTWFFSTFSKLYKFCNCANHSNISSNMAKTWCWMKCWTGLLRPYGIHETGKLKYHLLLKTFKWINSIVKSWLSWKSVLQNLVLHWQIICIVKYQEKQINNWTLKITDLHLWKLL